METTVDEVKGAASGSMAPVSLPHEDEQGGTSQRRWFVMKAAPVTRTAVEGEETKEAGWEFVHTALLEYFFVWYSAMSSETTSEMQSTPARSLSALIQRLGITRFTHMPRVLHMHAELAAEFPDLQQLYVHIVLESRQLQGDPKQDERLVIAASNAISILNHGATHGLLPFRFASHPDWSGIRVPYANLNNAQLLRCKLDAADLSHATLSNAQLLGSSFVGANLQHVRLPLLMRFTGYSDVLQHVCFSLDGMYLAVGLRDSVLIYDLHRHKLVRNLKASRLSAQALSFGSDATRIVSGTHDGHIRYHNVKTGSCVRAMGEDASCIKCLAVHPNGREVAAASEDGKVRVWDVTTGKVIVRMRTHEEKATVVSYSSDGNCLISGGLDSTVWICDALHGTDHYEKISNPGLHAAVVAVSVDAGLVASDNTNTNEPKSISLWGLRTGQRVGLLNGCSTSVSALAFNPTGQWLASGGHDGVINLWRVEDRRCVARLRGHTDIITSLGWSPDSQRVASSSWDRSVCLWDASYHDDVDCEYPYDPRQGHPAPITSIRFSWDESDGRPLLVSGSEDGTVRVWDPCAGQCTMVLMGHMGQINQVACSDDGRWIASAAADAMLRLWSVKTGECALTMRHGRYSANALAFAPRPPPGGNPSSSGMPYLVTASDDSIVRVWRPLDDSYEEWKCNDNILQEKRRLVGVAWNHTAECVVACGGVRVEAWRLSGGEANGHEEDDPLERVVPPMDLQNMDMQQAHSRSVNCVSYAPRSNLLASGGDDCMIRLWRVTKRATKRYLCELRGHVGGVNGLAWSPDEAYLASAGADGTIRIWSVMEHGSSGSCVATLKCAVGAWTDVAWSSDGSLIAGAGRDCCIYVWKRVARPDAVGAGVGSLEMGQSGDEETKSVRGSRKPNGDGKGSPEGLDVPVPCNETFIAELYSILGNTFAPNFKANWKFARMDASLATVLKEFGDQPQQQHDRHHQQTSKCVIA